MPRRSCASCESSASHSTPLLKLARLRYGPLFVGYEATHRGRALEALEEARAAAQRIVEIGGDPSQVNMYAAIAQAEAILGVQETLAEVRDELRSLQGTPQPGGDGAPVRERIFTR